MDQKINIGILGCAAIAERSVIPAIKNLSDAYNLVAVSSRNAVKAEKLASIFNCEAIVGYDQMIAREDIDALYIPLPTGLHKEWINKALNSGKHVYAEKSIALNLQDCESMVQAAKKNHVALMEGFMFQYHRQHDHLKQLILNDEIGELRFFSASFGFPPLDKDNFRYDPVLGGGALYDAGAYPLRAAFFILGDNLIVNGAAIKRDTNGASIYGSAFLKGESGVGASISFGFDNYYQSFYQLWGSKGKITVEKAYTPRPHMVPTFLLENQNGVQTIESVADDHFQKALLEFQSIILNSERRNKHFKEILQQSAALEIINSY